MMLFRCFVALCIPLLAAGQGGNFQLTFDSGSVADTGATPLDELTFTLNYSPSSNVNGVNEPEVYPGACTENPPATMTPMSGETCLGNVAYDETVVTFAFDPVLAPTDWEPTENNFLFCVYLLSSNGRVFEEVTIDLTLSPDSYDDTPVVTFGSASNNVVKSVNLGVAGKDVLATAVLCEPTVTTFYVGQEICIQIGLDDNGAYFHYKLDDGTPLEPFTNIVLSTDAGLSATVTPSTPGDTTVTPVGDAVNSQKVYFYLPTEFYYSGSRTVTADVKVNIVDASGNAIARRLQLSTGRATQEDAAGEDGETPDYVNDQADVNFNIVPEKDQICIDIDKLIWIVCGLVAGLVLFCCFAVLAVKRNRRKQGDEECQEEEGKGASVLPADKPRYAKQCSV